MITNPSAFAQLPPPAQRKRMFALCLLCTLGLSLFASAQDPTFITFDPPGSIQTVTGIDPAGEIIGTFYDASGASHGFVRVRDGTITTFDAPGQGQISPFLLSISPKGAITGSYTDTNFATHGFVRARDGTITSFDVPGATGFLQGTLPSSINPAEVITGSWGDTTFPYARHYFVRAPDGTITTFDVPGSTGFQPFLEFSLYINPKRVITGSYAPSLNSARGFVRARDGTITTFDAAGVVRSGPSPAASTRQGRLRDST